MKNALIEDLYNAKLVFHHFPSAAPLNAGLCLFQRITGKGDTIRLPLDIGSW
jgi:hypothetical protein